MTSVPKKKGRSKSAFRTMKSMVFVNATGFLGPSSGRLGGHVGLIFGPSFGDVPSFSQLILGCPHVKKP